jgi:hypothetical protein
MNRSVFIALSTALMLAILVLPIASLEGSTSKMEVGISLHSFSATDAQFAKDSGAQWIRIDVDSNFKQAVANAKNESLKVLGILGSWMFAKNTTFKQDQWTQAVTDYVSNNTNVDAWEIWNEPANKAYPLMTNNANNNLTQTVQNYYWMVKTSSSIIRQYTPSAKIVLLGGMQIYADSNQIQVDKEFAGQLAQTNVSLYGDAISIHAYNWNQNIQTVLNQYSQNLNYYKSLFNNMPVWVTETGQPTEYSGEIGQATYLTTAFQFFNDKVSNVFWYSLYDNPDEVNLNPSQHFGLVSSTGATRKSYSSMQQFITDQNATPQPTTTSNPTTQSPKTTGIDTPTPLPTTIISPSTITRSTSYKANMYLANNYNPKLHLIAETNISQKYWLVSDNLLASHALKNYNQTISNDIDSKLKSIAAKYNIPTDLNGLPKSYKHEALIGDILSEPFRNSSQENGTLLVNGTNYSIVTEIDDFAIIEDWQKYSDLLALRGISLCNQKTPEATALAKDYFYLMMNSWDENGFADRAYTDPNSTSYHVYQTYKLGLALILSNDLKIVNSSVNNKISSIITLCQNQDGGVITGYELRNGSIERSQFATTNTETTAILSLADVQDNYIDNNNNANWWIVVAIVVIGVVCASSAILWKHRSLTRFPSSS